jgi:hypothetical protein
MTQDEARQHLTAMMVEIQKFRSNVMETRNDDLDRELTAELFPWAFKKCPIPALVKILDRDKIVPMDLYNMMYLLHRFLPEVLIGCEYHFPKPDASWIALEFED